MDRTVASPPKRRSGPHPGALPSGGGETAVRAAVRAAHATLADADVLLLGPFGPDVVSMFTASGAQVRQVREVATAVGHLPRVNVALATGRLGLGSAGLLRRAKAGSIDTPVVLTDSSPDSCLMGLLAGAAATCAPMPALILATCASVARTSRRTVDVRLRGSRPGGGKTRARVTVLVDSLSRDAWVDGQPASLSPREFDTLAALAAAPGTVHAARMLAAEVWPDGRASADTVTETIRRIRVRLTAAGADEVIITRRGSGWVVYHE